MKVFGGTRKSFGGVYLPWTGDNGCVLVSPGVRGLTGETAPDADVADTTATTTSGSESWLPHSGLRLWIYRRPVKRRGHLAAASVVLSLA